MDEDNSNQAKLSINILDNLTKNLAVAKNQELIDKIEHIKSSIDLMGDRVDLEIFQTIESQLGKKDIPREEEIKDAIKNLSIEIGVLNLNRYTFRSLITSPTIKRKGLICGYEEEFSEDSRKEIQERLESVKQAANKCEEVREKLSEKLQQKYEEEHKKWEQEYDYQENERKYKAKLRDTSKKISFMTSDISHYERQSKKCDEVLVQEQIKYDILHKIKIDLKRALKGGMTKPEVAKLMIKLFNEKEMDYELNAKIYHESEGTEREGKSYL